MTAQKHSASIFAGKLRRFFIVHFRKNYLERQLRSRRGDCLQCGVCCNFSLPCPMLTKRRLCLVYGVCRPKACRVFPIDQKDLDDVAACGGVCGYRFESRPSPAHSRPRTTH